MRLVSWNCNGALRKKTALLDELEADILIIQECEDPAQSTAAYQDWAGQYLWTGHSRNKGLGVFAKHDQPLRPLNWDRTQTPDPSDPTQLTPWGTKDLEFFLPFQVGDLTAVAVWTKRKKVGGYSYIGQAWRFIHLHKDDIPETRFMFIGDFNSNAIWDRPRRNWNFSDVMRHLKERNIKSLYHHATNEDYGNEKTPTFYFFKKQEKPFHIDYAFCSLDILEHARIKIEPYDRWVEKSDHVPLVIDIQ